MDNNIIFPPDNFESLRQITVLLRQGEIELPIGKKSLCFLEKMLNDTDLVASCNIVELADKLDFSPASITRLAKLLGFQGFNQLKTLFKQKSKIPNNFYSDKAQQLLDKDKSKPKALFKEHLQNTIFNAEQFIEQVNEADLSRASAMLAKKHRIFIFGYRQSSAIANILRYGLALLRPNVQMLVQADHGVAVALGQLKRDDLLVVIGSAPYSNITLKIASLAKKQQCQILAITDSLLSPLNSNANVTIQVPSSGQYYANSLVVNCFFVESLLSLTTMELGQTAVNNLQHHETLLSKLDVST
jgi:DNA-binding MurR/RpiR family transcriptional regulator